MLLTGSSQRTIFPRTRTTGIRGSDTSRKRGSGKQFKCILEPFIIDFIKSLFELPILQVHHLILPALSITIKHRCWPMVCINVTAPNVTQVQ